MRLFSCTTALALATLCSCATTPSAHEKILVEFPVHPETRDEFIVALHEILHDTRAYEGCKAVTVWTDEGDEDTVWLYEEWETREHQAAYINWRRETGNTAHLGAFISSDLSFHWLEER